MDARELANQICRTLRRNGHQAYLVGGCVRDILLKREPADYDVATDAIPERVQELFPRSLDVGAQFGVVIVTDECGASGSGDVSLGYRLLRWTSPGPGGVFENAAGGRSAPRFHDQCLAARPRDGRGARFCGWARRPSSRNHPSDRAAGGAVSRRQAADDSRGAFRRALSLRG